MPLVVNQLVSFWDRDIPPDESGRCIHPEDRSALPRDLPPLLEAGLRIPPAPYLGPLLSARIVLLALNPGHPAIDDERAASPDGQRWWREQRTGRALYDYGGWFRRKLEWLGDWNILQPHVAKLNRYAYASKSSPVSVRRVLAALPSSQLILEWARDELFPKARRGELVVFVTRSHDTWGLECGRDEGSALFCSFVPVSSLPMVEDRPRMIAAVRDFLGLPI